MSKNVDGLYHREVRIPQGWKDNVVFNFNLNWTNHAKQEASKEGLPLFTKIKFNGSEVFEWKVTKDKLEKIAVRIRGEHRDIILVLSQDARVITCWTNDSNDCHRTLNTERYIH